MDKKRRNPPATGNTRQRLNVIGALLSSGKLLITKRWLSVTGLWFSAFLMAVVKQVKNPLVVILDNVSIHTAKLGFIDRRRNVLLLSTAYIQS
ncbi:MAG: transposase [bacterium]